MNLTISKSKQRNLFLSQAEAPPSKNLKTAKIALKIFLLLAVVAAAATGIHVFHLVSPAGIAETLLGTLATPTALNALVNRFFKERISVSKPLPTEIPLQVELSQISKASRALAEEFETATIERQHSIISELAFDGLSQEGSGELLEFLRRPEKSDAKLAELTVNQRLFLSHLQSFGKDMLLIALMTVFHP